MSSLAETFLETGCLRDEFVVDAHGHVGFHAAQHAWRISAADVVRVMDQLGVDRAWIFSLAGASSDYVLGNTDCIRAVREFGDRFDGLAFLNPCYPSEVLSEIERCYEAGLIGMVFDPGSHGYAMDAVGLEPVWKFAEDNGALLVSTHWGPPAFLESILKALSNVVVVCCRQVMEYAELAGTHENFYITAHGSPEYGALNELVRRAGKDKVLFGSDFTCLDVGAGLGSVVLGSLDDEAKRAILGANAARIMERVRAANKYA